MPSSTLAPPDIRAADHASHHLHLHGKTWWVYVALRPTLKMKERLRRPLSTESLSTARRRRDELFRRLESVGLLSSLHARKSPRATGILQRHTPMGLEYAEAILADVIQSLPV